MGPSQPRGASKMNSKNPLMSPLGLSILAILMILIVLAAELPALVSSVSSSCVLSDMSTDSVDLRPYVLFNLSLIHI